MAKPGKVVTAIEIAREWRLQNGYTGRGGVVVVWNDIVQSWVQKLCEPHHWQPGCIAVGEDESSWTTVAGNEKDGALLWLQNEVL